MLDRGVTRALLRWRRRPLETLKRTIEAYAAASDTLRTAVEADGIDAACGKDGPSVALTTAERHVDELEAAILDYRPLSPSELFEKMRFVRQHVMDACEQSERIAAILTAVARDVRDMLGVPAYQVADSQFAMPLNYDI